MRLVAKNYSDFIENGGFFKNIAGSLYQLDVLKQRGMMTRNKNAKGCRHIKTALLDNCNKESNQKALVIKAACYRLASWINALGMVLL